MKENYYALLMAGGVGSRFWPVSTAANPKQFQDILGTGVTLLQTTFNRLAQLIPKENILILTNKEYKDIVQEQLPGVKPEQIVLEPEMRNTAPSILLGALKIMQKDENGVMVVAPSDHWIQGEDAFIANIREAFEAVEKQDMLVTLGIGPTFPNTGYGYINYDKEAETNLKPVLRFTEKPSFKKAEKFLEDGNYVWNAGIFIWSARFILENFKKYLPEMHRLLTRNEEVYNTPKEQEFLDENYAQADNVSIDYGIMENSDRVYVIPAEFKWNDLGTWTSLQDELPHDEHGNTAVNAQLMPEAASGNIIRTQGHKIVVVDGLENYIVVESEKVLLIVPKNKVQEIKDIRNQVMEKFGKDMG
ncbi:MAG: mannose-1-phosphate guanylyltransferase [Salegentibacter sp.]